LSHLREANGTKASDKTDADKLYKALGKFEFILGMVIWHDILFDINNVSKKLQSWSMCIESVLQQIENMRNYFDNYRNEGFSSNMVIAKGIATKMGVDPSFPIKHKAVIKKQFDEMDY
jgi:hypothetical protein